jgi:hypothetical protein
MPNDMKPLAVSFPGAAKAWSVCRGTAYKIVKENPWIRVLAVYGSKRAIPYEDVEEYLRRCKNVGVSADTNSNKLKSVEAARAANATKKAARAAKGAKAAKANKPPAAPAPAPLTTEQPPLQPGGPAE